MFFAFAPIFWLPGVWADIGVISYWVPELYALLRVIEDEGSSLTTHTFGGRRFYVTRYRGHNIIAVNAGESISNSAATTTILLQKFPNVDRIIGTGIAGGVVSSSLVSCRIENLGPGSLTSTNRLVCTPY